MPCGDGTGPLGSGCCRGCFGIGCGRMRNLNFYSENFIPDKDLRKSFIETEIKRVENYKKFLEKALEDIQK
jgi:hypothetical protein